ncbi:HipA domain-containing protein [Escherichia coli]|uniref:HipA domain-containing protein n=1 Tax=Escherichia coli TaxID=562 RepID=UPI00339C29B5
MARRLILTLRNSVAIVFNILVTNTDDHLRNHGLLIPGKGWRLSEAYDLNPVVRSDGLKLDYGK